MGVNNISLSTTRQWSYWSLVSNLVLGSHSMLAAVALASNFTIHSLGILLDAPGAAVAHRFYHQLMQANQMQPFLDRRDLAVVTHALVTSRLEYFNPLCVGLPLKTTWKLQQVQNAVACMLSGKPRFHCARPALASSCFLGIVHGDSYY